MILFCDTTGVDVSLLALVTKQGRVLRTRSIRRNDRIGDQVFRAITKFFKKDKPEAIIVVVGPGRFSGIRHGIALANTLAFAWGIQVAGVVNPNNISARALAREGIELLRRHPTSFVLPAYGQEPTITLPKKKRK